MKDKKKTGQAGQGRAAAAARIAGAKTSARRRRIMIQGAVLTGVLALAGLTAAAVVANRPMEIADSGPAPASANAFGGINTSSALTTDLTVDTASIPEAVDGTPPGISAPGDGEPASVVIYVDPNCVHCADFEEDYGSFLKDLAGAGDISLETRTIAILDRNSPTNYSSRAANAMACAADTAPGSYLDYTAAVFANYPSGELANQELVDLAAESGITGIDDCVKDGKFRPFVKFTTEAATEHGITGTPTIFINGEMWDLKGDFEAIVKEAAAA